jgi:CRP-like cAMP-binding protein
MFVTIRCTEDCVLWALDRDTFRKIMMSTGKQDMSQRVEFLNKVTGKP